MKAKRQPVKLQSKRPAPLGAQAIVLGVDGGGTKTRAVVVGARRRVLGEGEAGPSNPLRVGVNEAAHAVREAAERACAEAGVRRIEVVAAEVGLAGVKRADIRERMRAALSELGIKSIEVVTDADIALYGATEGKPGLVIIAGTGSQTATLSRWGDYSALTVDPVDGCTFWYTTEYLKTSGTFNWSTRIASFRLPTCQ